jgi:hypothetical protein
MSRPEPRLVAKILSLQAVQDLGITQIHPILVPQGRPYPAIVYQVLRDWPESPADGRTDSHWIKIRVSCLARGSDGYAAIRALATAVEGDSGRQADGSMGEPSGVSGWLDDEGNCWLKEESFDEGGEIQSGTDHIEAYCINQIYQTAYVP